MLGKKIHTHFLPKRTGKCAQTMIWLDLHITFYTLQTKSKQAAICRKLSKLLPHCWTSEGAVLIWFLDLFVAKLHIRKLTVMQISVGPSPVLSLLPLENPCFFSFFFWLLLTHGGSPANLVNSRADPELVSPAELSRFTKSNTGPQHIWQTSTSGPHNTPHFLCLCLLVKATIVLTVLEHSKEVER